MLLSVFQEYIVRQSIPLDTEMNLTLIPDIVYMVYLIPVSLKSLLMDIHFYFNNSSNRQTFIGKPGVWFESG